MIAARRRRLLHSALAAALAAAALLTASPPADAARDRVAGGTATVHLSAAFRAGLAAKGVKLRSIDPSTLGGTAATFAVRGGELDPTTGRGTVSLGIGGLQLRRGRKAAAVRSLAIDTRRGELSANVAGRKLTLASFGGWSDTREGFGVSLAIRRLRLTRAATAQLNRRLGGRVLAGGQALGSVRAQTHPGTVTVLPGGSTTLTASEASLAKLAKVGVAVVAMEPSLELNPLSGKPSFQSPIASGAIGPAATAGALGTDGGILFVQELGPLVSRVWIERIQLDLGAGTVTAEVFGESNAEIEPGKRPLDFGEMGRIPIANLALGGAAVATDSAARTIALDQAMASLQATTAEVLAAFATVYEKSTGNTGRDRLDDGDPLGSFSFAAQTQ